jgi:ribonucleoside-diphosphate reductase alpha chain
MIINNIDTEVEMKQEEIVIKRDGSQEPRDVNKIHRVCEFGCEGIEGVSVSELEMEIVKYFHPTMTTKEINEFIVSACKSLMIAGKYHYDKVGGRIISFIVRKEAYGDFKAPHLLDIVARNVVLGRYDPDIPSMYTNEEWNQIDAMIDHSRDELFRLAGAEQMRVKYLSKNRITKQIYESFQIPFILVPAILFRNDENKMELIKQAYDNLSLFDISEPSPVMSGVRTILKQFSSCVLIDVDDTIDSIGASHHAILKYVSNKAGLGVNVGRNRGLGAPIKGGEAVHTGLIPFIKDLTAGTKSCSQGGMRDGAVTFSFPFWYYEMPELIMLKDTTLPAEQTNRQADYCVQMNRFIYKRIKENKDFALFSPYETPGLYEAFFSDQTKFEYLYEKYEADLSIRRRTFPAQKLFNDLVTQRSNTGRIYISNVDHVNDKSSFKVPIYMTNLCVAEHTKVLTDKGHLQIETLVGEKINVWNGFEWSEVIPVKTGVEQYLLKISFSDGAELTCTPYHKFYIQKTYQSVTPLEVRASDLTVGQNLIKFDLPVIDFAEDFPYAYTHGVFCGDGTYEGEGKPRVTLYPGKHHLVEYLENRLEVRPEIDGRLNVRLPIDLPSKFEVPSAHSITSRLQWLEGLCDTDGTVSRNNENESIQISSINHDFLLNVRLMLQTLGISSKVTLSREAGFTELPNGKGGVQNYETQNVYRLLINSNGLYKLLALGFSPKRLKVLSKKPQRDATRFISVTDIQLAGVGDTYCFNEPKRHYGIFNGILTGNCVEITLPTTPFEDVKAGFPSEISICTLGAINWGKINKPSDFEQPCRMAVRLADAVLDYQDYPVEAARQSTMARRPIGIGIIGFAHFLAKRGLPYGRMSLALVDEYAEAWSFYLLKASMELAMEKGACPRFNETKYSDGWTPNMTRTPLLDKILPHVERQDWTWLRSMIVKHGLRNSTLMAGMPSETSSQLSNETNGVEPAMGPVIVKASKDTVPPIAVPDVDELMFDYDWLWEQKSPRGYLEVVAVLQKYMDQAISVNTSYNPKFFKDEKLDTATLGQDLMYAYLLGNKNIYYQNTKKPGEAEILGFTEADVGGDSGCESGACHI